MSATDATDPPFAVGTLVKLRSGGPLLTVTRVGVDVECMWFQTEEFKARTFPAAALVVSRDDPPPVASR